jgi:hypothetical protein
MFSSPEELDSFFTSHFVDIVVTVYAVYQLVKMVKRDIERRFPKLVALVHESVLVFNSLLYYSQIKIVEEPRFVNPLIIDSVLEIVF